MMTNWQEEEDEYGEFSCDICGIPLEADECFTITHFFGEGEDGVFCYEHYSQMTGDEGYYEEDEDRGDDPYDELGDEHADYDDFGAEDFEDEYSKEAD